MKSICIKTNNTHILTYISNEIKHIECKDIQYSINKFSHYSNIIIHYLGENNNLFIQSISQVLAFTLIDEFEEKLLLDLITKHYFYFTNSESEAILSNCFSVLADDFNELFAKKFDILKNSFSEFFSENKFMILDGFINFRLKNYFNILEDILSEAISIFLVEKEYTDFVSLLQTYISDEKPICELIHLVYSQKDNLITLFDENYITLPLNHDIKSIKYLGDISFSNNDLILNTLLSNIPKKLVIHIPSGNINEFISTIILIFNAQVSICNNCNFCSKANICT